MGFDQMICKKCGKETDRICNDHCLDCWRIVSDAWQARMDKRQNAKRFDPQKLVNIMLQYNWQHECQIITDYMPPFPGKDTRPTCVIMFEYLDVKPDAHRTTRFTFLRYSHGPLQGYFWDVYGDHFNSPELALWALSQAPPPVRIDYIIPTHGR